MTIAVDVGPAQEVGAVGGRVRRHVPIIGGQVSGGFVGRILPGGGDWQTVGDDGVIDIAARYVLELEEGLVEVESTGLRYANEAAQAAIAAGEAPPPGSVYFRTAMRFRTASPALAHLNALMGMAIGRRLADQVLLSVFRVP